SPSWHRSRHTFGALRSARMRNLAQIAYRLTRTPRSAEQARNTATFLRLRLSSRRKENERARGGAPDPTRTFLQIARKTCSESDNRASASLLSFIRTTSCSASASQKSSKGAKRGSKNMKFQSSCKALTRVYDAYL